MPELHFSVVLTQANIRKAISVLFLLSITDTTCGHSKYATAVIQFPVDTRKKAEMETECTTSTSRSNDNEKKRITP